MSEHAPSRETRHGVAWPIAIGAAALTFLVAVLMPPLAALAGVVALVALTVGARRPLPRRSSAVAAGVLAAVFCYLAIWAIGSVLDPGDPESGRATIPAPATTPQQP